MTNICAAIGLAQLEQADEILDKKRHIALWYINELSALPLIMHEEVQHTKHSYWMCSFIVNEKSKRDPLRKYLYNQGIETRPIFYPAHTLPHSQSHGNYPTAVMISKSGINLPSFPGLNEEQLNKIRDGIYEFYE